MATQSHDPLSPEHFITSVALSAFDHSRALMMRDLETCEQTVNSINVLTFHTYYASLGVCLAIAGVPQLMQTGNLRSARDFNRSGKGIYEDLGSAIGRIVTLAEPPKLAVGPSADVVGTVCDALFVYAVDQSSKTVTAPADHSSRRDAELAGHVAAARAAIDIVQAMMEHYDVVMKRDHALIGASIQRCLDMNGRFLEAAMDRQRLYYACEGLTHH